MPTITVRAERAARNPQSPPLYGRLPERALADRKLTRTALALLGRLDRYARDKAFCWPAVATLAEDLGVCRRTVQLALGRLKEGGYVAEEPAKNRTGRVLVLLWKSGAQRPAAQAPYSQGLPRPRTPVAPEGKARPGKIEGKVGSASGIPEPPPRPMERPPTAAEQAQTLREFIGAVPIDTPLARLLEKRLARMEGRPAS